MLNNCIYNSVALILITSCVPATSNYFGWDSSPLGQNGLKFVTCIYPKGKNLCQPLSFIRSFLLYQDMSIY
jgi:hypothetical protein